MRRMRSVGAAAVGALAATALLNGCMVNKAELEDGWSLPAGASVRTEAGTSGGQFVRFDQAGAATKSYTTRYATLLAPRVRKPNTACGGTVSVRFEVDGRTVVNTTPVTSSSWANLGGRPARTLHPGSHTFKVTYPTDTGSCSLDVDVVQYGLDGKFTPAPPAGTNYCNRGGGYYVCGPNGAAL
jgi:hypothetical protein